ncbi:MAG: TlpA disulfide reductase family protein, partial [Mariprofundus sp.]|nr:TlpA disulfide reductase family protein [Mariprofundus sp.]
VDRGNKEVVRRFMQRVAPQFHTLLDPDGGVRNRYAVRGLPTTYLIRSNGHIIGRMIGERDWSSPAMHEMVQLLVANE